MERDCAHAQGMKERERELHTIVYYSCFVFVQIEFL